MSGSSEIPTYLRTPGSNIPVSKKKERIRTIRWKIPKKMERKCHELSDFCDILDHTL